jgi:hypothetical protein
MCIYIYLYTYRFPTWWKINNNNQQTQANYPRLTQPWWGDGVYQATPWLCFCLTIVFHHALQYFSQSHLNAILALWGIATWGITNYYQPSIYQPSIYLPTYLSIYLSIHLSNPLFLLINPTKQNLKTRARVKFRDWPI